MARFAVWLSTIAAVAPCACGDAFLGRVSKDDIEQAFFLDLSNANKVATFEDDLRPMYQTLPKNEQGQLDPSTVRYALHRYFVHKHGWYVKGLDPQGSGLGNSSSTVMSEFVPAYILQLLEQRGQGRGLALKELAVFAATLSDLIFQEGFGGLWEVYQKLELPFEASISEEDFDRAVRGYFSELVCGQWFTFKSKGDFAELERTAREFYPEYDDIMMWAADLRRTRDFAEYSSRNPFVERAITWERAAVHLSELMHNFGSLANDECRGLKEQLLEMEVPGTGRVMLSDFYSNSKLQLHESVAYLRNQAALEEDGTTSPRIVISNYIGSTSRCSPFSSYFSICCRDECEGLLASMERIIGTPTATPARIAEEASMLASDTKSAPWEVSPQLLRRLQEIASHHQGQVPLHGRLFMQWMHHAFPAECPFPHVSGTTSPVSQDDWLVLHDDIDDVRALASEKATFVQDKVATHSSMVDLPWMAVEELVAVDKPTRKPQAFQNVLRFAMGIVAVVSFALPLIRLSSALFSSNTDKTVHLV